MVMSVCSSFKSFSSRAEVVQVSSVNFPQLAGGASAAMSAISTNGPAEPCTDGKSRQQQQVEKAGKEKKAEPQAGVVDENSQTGRPNNKPDSSKKETVDGKRPLTLQDLIDFTNESP